MALAVVVTALVLASCADGNGTPNGGPPTSDMTTTVATTVPTLPPPRPWTPSPAEPAPNAKVLAARLVETVGTYAFGGGTTEAAGERLIAAGFPPGVAASAGALLAADAASSAEVIYPQLGGLTATAASVMVVTSQRVISENGDERQTTRTVDVRLTRAGGPWSVATIASDGTRPIAEPTDDAAVRELLAAKDLELPDSAVADLLSGSTDPRLVEMLRRLIRDHALRVTVLATGHPVNVFETERTSNHTAGRGVDIWSIDGVAVVDQQRSFAVRAVMDAALAAGASEIGAPFDPDGPGGRVFSNTVHLDHLHLAFSSP